MGATLMSKHKKQSEGYRILKNPEKQATLELEKLTGISPNRKLRRKLMSNKYRKKARGL